MEILAEIPGRFRHAPSYIVAEPLCAFAVGDLVQLPLKDSVVRVGARAVVSVGDRGIGAVRTTRVIVIVVVGITYFFRLQPPEWVVVMIPNPVVIRVKLPGQASRVVVLVRPESHVGIADGSLSTQIIIRNCNDLSIVIGHLGEVAHEVVSEVRIVIARASYFHDLGHSAVGVVIRLLDHAFAVGGDRGPGVGPVNKCDLAGA